MRDVEAEALGQRARPSRALAASGCTRWRRSSSSASHSASAAAWAWPRSAQGRIGGTLDRPLVDAHRERVADEQQLHGSSVLACAAVADLFVAEQPGPPGARRVVFCPRLARSQHRVRAGGPGARRPHGAPLRPARVREVAGRRARRRASTTQVDDLASVVGDEPAIVVGHSLGGVVALTFASRHPAAGAGGRRVRGADAVAHVVALEHRGRRGAGRVRRRGRGGGALHAPDRRRRPVGGAAAAHARTQRRAEGPALVAELRSLRPPTPGSVRRRVRFRCPWWPDTVVGHGRTTRRRRAGRSRATAPRGELVIDRGGVARRPPAATRVEFAGRSVSAGVGASRDDGDATLGIGERSTDRLESGR